MTTFPESLDENLHRLARVPQLMVCTDYDGTIAPIVPDPSHAVPHREAIVALRMLASLPQTHVAIISGRGLRDLAGFVGPHSEVHLVGSHGSEFDLDFATSLPADASERLKELLADLEGIAAGAYGFYLERKPASIAFHYRNADAAAATSAIQAIKSGPAARPGIHARHGKSVVELSIVSTNKGDALTKLRGRIGASAVIFFGDDVTDEDAFATLTGPDLAIKVGEGDTVARYRVDGPHTVARLLARLAELRADWLAGPGAVPIEQHAILTDQRSFALLTPAGRITWMCVPRIDSPALFAELLGGESAGYFAIKAADGTDPIEQHYVHHSLVLQTTWNTFCVTDFMDCSAGQVNQRAGRTELLRRITGTGKVVIEFAPRPDFGQTPIRVQPRSDGLQVVGMLEPLVLRSPAVHWEIIEDGDHQMARSEIDLPEEGVSLELRFGTGSLRESARSVTSRLDLTQRYWSSWVDRLEVPDVEPEFVRHSALVLKALCYGPTGAIAAAGTTSLPEHVGGVRNWDYRYCWIRDGAMSAAALVKLGSVSEAIQFLDWMLGVVDGCESPERLSPLYDVTGKPLGTEAEVGDLAGYRGSRPVRVGNSASRQVQLDVFGPVVELVCLLIERNAPLSSQHWSLVESMVQAVEARWHEPDHGIWEIRKPPRHHVHSKVMCWFTVDRAIQAAGLFLDREPAGWATLRDRIAEDVLQNGYKPDVEAFTAAYDGNDYDAAALWVGLSGLLPPGDDRFANTVTAIEQHLFDEPTVFRYRVDDGLPGAEGGFHICASWLVEAYILLGRIDDAWRLFNQLKYLAGRTGMLSEQYEPAARISLGNVPQAYSHLGIIENAIRLANLSSDAR